MRLFLFLSTLVALSLPPRVSADPPKLVSTSPQYWAIGVNPAAQKTISLTFDQRLRGRLTDWIGRDVLSPPSNLQTTFSADNMSCSINVHLDAGRVYICGINGRGLPGVGFQNEKGAPLPPTYLVFQTAGTPTADNAPPHALKSVPANGSQVDPAKVTAINVTFDQQMGTAKHGLHLFENGSPIDLSKLEFGYSPDGRTFTLPYKLKPATAYRLEFNNVSDIGFSRANGVPLWPAQISFTTQ